MTILIGYRRFFE